MDTFRYRLYTEDVNQEFLHNVINESFPGYTVFIANGYWNSKSEPSIVFEIVSSALGTLSVLNGIADLIKRNNKQEAVLVTREPVESFLY